VYHRAAHGARRGGRWEDLCAHPSPVQRGQGIAGGAQAAGRAAASWAAAPAPAADPPPSGGDLPKARGTPPPAGRRPSPKQDQQRSSPCCNAPFVCSGTRPLCSTSSARGDARLVRVAIPPLSSTRAMHLDDRKAPRGERRSGGGVDHRLIRDDELAALGLERADLVLEDGALLVLLELEER